MKKLVYAIAIMFSMLPSVARAQWPPSGFWNDGNVSPLTVTGNYTMTVNNPVIVVASPGGAALTMSKCWAGQRFDIFIDPSGTSLADFTASGAGTTLTVSAVTDGVISIGTVIYGSGIPYGTKITGQISGTAGGVGQYSTNQATTASSASVMSGAVTVLPAGNDSWLSGADGAMWITSYVTSLLAIGTPSGSCSWVIK